MKLMICIIIFLFFGATIVDAIDINHCSTLDIAGEKYTMTADVSTNDSICFKITAENITIDCNNFSINVNNILDVGGIYSYQSNSIENNCNISISTPDGIIANPTNPVKDSEKDSKKALFDIVLEILTEPKKSGEDLITKVSLINFGASNTIDANLKYTISNSKGNTIKQYAKNMPVTTQTEFLDHINTTGIPNGKYTIKIELFYDGQTFPAHAEKIFYIGGTESLIEFIGSANAKIFILPIIAIALLIGVYRKSRIKKLKENNYAIENNRNNTNSIEKLDDKNQF